MTLSHTRQTIDDIYQCGLSFVYINVEIDIPKNGATSVDPECPDDIMARGHRENSNPHRIRAYCIPGLQQFNRDPCNILALPMHVCYDQGYGFQWFKRKLVARER